MGSERESFGSPSTRSPTMFFMISSVPPAMRMPGIPSTNSAQADGSKNGRRCDSHSRRYKGLTQCLLLQDACTGAALAVTFFKDLVYDDLRKFDELRQMRQASCPSPPLPASGERVG